MEPRYDLSAPSQTPHAGSMGGADEEPGNLELAHNPSK